MFAIYQSLLNQSEYCATAFKHQPVTTVSSADEPIRCAVEQIHYGARTASTAYRAHSKRGPTRPFAITTTVLAETVLTLT